MKYNIKEDFSEIEGAGEADREFTRKAAQYFLTLTGLNELETSAGAIDVRVTPGETDYLTGGNIEISPAKGSRITNLELTLQAIELQREHEILHQDNGKTSMRLYFGNGHVNVTIIQDPDQAEKETVEHSEPIPLLTYMIMGDRRQFDEEVCIEKDPTTTTELEELLRSTINAISIDTGKSPNVMYTKEEGKLSRADVFPPRGSRIIGFDLSSEALPKRRQKKGMITYSHGNMEFCIHRTNLYEKFDIRGWLDPANNVIANPTPEDSEQVVQILAQLPITIKSSDDREANVAYTLVNERVKSVYITPKEGSELALHGFAEAKAARQLNEKPDSKEQSKHFTLKDGRVDVYIMPKSSKISAKWERMGGAKKDPFDRFYAISEVLAKWN